jgi:hypothetical protein
MANTYTQIHIHAVFTVQNKDEIPIKMLYIKCSYPVQLGTTISVENRNDVNLRGCPISQISQEAKNIFVIGLIVLY